MFIYISLYILWKSAIKTIIIVIIIIIYPETICVIYQIEGCGVPGNMKQQP